jgi:hypothetical protein
LGRRGRDLPGRAGRVRPGPDCGLEAHITCGRDGHTTFLTASRQGIGYTVTMSDSNDKKPKGPAFLRPFQPAEGRPKDCKLHGRRRGALILGGAVVTLLSLGLGLFPGLVESLYASGLSHLIARGLAAASGLVPTSLAEALLVLAAGWFLFVGGRAAWFVVRRRRGVLNALAGGVLHFGAIASVVAALFFVLWGLNYSRPGLIERMDWQAHAAPPESARAQARELRDLARKLVDAANEAYVETHGQRDLGVPSSSLMDWRDLDAAIDDGYARLAEDLPFESGFGAPRGSSKPVTLSVLMNYLHISGFYFPWTGEANVSRLQPGCVLPFVIAHEKAHQRGVASEDEANFVGFAASIRSSDPYVRYTGYLYAQRQILWELMAVDPAAALKLIDRRLPGVQRDVDGIREYWSHYQQGVAAVTGELSRAVNDTYLRANRVEGGIRNYDMSTALIITYYRSR